MIGQYLHKLLSIASPAIGATVRFSPKTGLLGEWLELVSERNGFYAFESALFVRPAIHQHPIIYDVKSWNKPECWLETYDFPLPKMHFFAEDVFGEQFSILDDSILRFDPETGEYTHFASSFDEWARAICDNYNYETGYELAHEWQSTKRPLAIGERLIPRIPFVLGGEYAVSNLWPWNDRKGMRARGLLATQLRNVPEGSQISFILEE
jgi:hypothetical protein